MQSLLNNIGLFLNNLLVWFSNLALNLLSNPIFIVFFSFTIFVIIYSLILDLINEIQARKLGISLTGSTDELEYYRSLSDEEKQKYDEEHL